jgi:hypothetical protein
MCVSGWARRWINLGSATENQFDLRCTGDRTLCSWSCGTDLVTPRAICRAKCRPEYNMSCSRVPVGGFHWFHLKL